MPRARHLLLSFSLLIIACLPGADSSEKTDQSLDFFSINGRNVPIDHYDNFIIYPLIERYYTANDFHARIIYPDDKYELYINSSFVPSNSDYLFRQVAINDSVTLTFESKLVTLTYNLIFSYLPVVEIFTITPLNEVKLPASLSIISSNLDYNLSHKQIGIEVRGNLSQTFPKKSFSIEFRNETNFDIKQDQRLLGMRKDDDWLLDGSPQDPTMLRNRVAMDLFPKIWRLPHDENASVVNRGRFVELVFNHRYHGIYVLSERIDRKLLKLDRQNSLLIKSMWAGPHGLQNRVAASLFEIKYPDTENDLFAAAEGWERLSSFLNFMEYSTDDDFENAILTKFDLDNAVNYHLLLLAVAAFDNWRHNYFLVQNNFDPFFFIPWDLDDAFRQIDHIPGNFVIDRLLAYPFYIQKLKKKWSILKQSALHYESVYEVFKTYYDPLLQSNAYKRNANRWAAYDHEAWLIELEAWLEKRHALIDEYIDSL